MKFSAAVSLAIAPVALAKAVHNVYPVRRDPNRGQKTAARQLGGVGVGAGVGSISAAELAALELTGLRSGVDVVLIWVNQGGGAATQTINQPVTVTNTVTVTGAAGAVAPPVATGAAPPPPPAGGTATPPQVGTPVAGGALTTHTVTLGGPKGLQFEPADIKANVGDMVVFTFLSQNHSATQSPFDTPCQPLEGGMNSGFQANPNNTVNPPPQVAMQVMDSKPLWFFCAQNGHCGKGMTFAINATPEKSFALFQSMAIAQNGAGSGSAITGNGGGAPAGAAPPAGAGVSGTAGAGAAVNTLAPLPGGAAATTPVGAAAPVGSGLATGTGTVLADGSCSCVVQCASGSFPAVQAQGVGNFGGAAGAVPANMVAIK